MKQNRLFWLFSGNFPGFVLARFCRFFSKQAGSFKHFLRLDLFGFEKFYKNDFLMKVSGDKTHQIPLDWYPHCIPVSRRLRGFISL